MPGVGTPDPDVCIERHPSMHQVVSTSKQSCMINIDTPFPFYCRYYKEL